MLSGYISATFLPKGENEMDVFLHLEGRHLGNGKTVAEAATDALQRVANEEVREVLYILQAKCIY